MPHTFADSASWEGDSVDEVTRSLSSLEVGNMADTKKHETPDLCKDGIVQEGPDEAYGIDEQEQETDGTLEGDVEEYSTDETGWDGGYYDDDYQVPEDHWYLSPCYNEDCGCWKLEDGCVVQGKDLLTHEHGDVRGSWNETEQGWDLGDGCFVKKLWHQPPVYGSHADDDWSEGDHSQNSPRALPIPVDFTTEYVKPTESIVLADSENTVQAMLRDVVSSARDDPRIIIDLEGNNLGRTGTIDLLILHIEHFNKTYLVDVVTLGKSAFEISVDHCRCAEEACDFEAITLKTVLESDEWPKLLWDCRTDSNALYFLFGVDLKGVEDVQLYENLQYTMDHDCFHPQKHYLLGLAKAIDRYAPIPVSEKNELAALKRSFKGQYHIFGIRPLSEEAIQYATNDVKHIGPMLDILARNLNRQERFMVKIEVMHRLEWSHDEGFYGSGDAPDWSECRGAPDFSWLLAKGWLGQAAVCNADCLVAWGHPHYCKSRCHCHGACEERREEIEQRLLKAEEQVFGNGFVTGDLHRAQQEAVRKAEEERDERLLNRCDRCEGWPVEKDQVASWSTSSSSSDAW